MKDSDKFLIVFAAFGIIAVVSIFHGNYFATAGWMAAGVFSLIAGCKYYEEGN